ncbi:MAG: trigger factor family protein, partial [Firmicutes bacterium]|nr:trigger factor family protein [Bacillota bacterium]
MKTTLLSKENTEAKFKMEFTPEEFEEAVVKVYKKEKGNFQIDGFRKGKA